jgi:effector-binding domain-containing protein
LLVPEMSVLIMDYDIHVKQVPPQVVVTARCRTSLAELGKIMHATLAKVATSVEPAAAAQVPPFAVYYNEPFRPEDVDVEMGLPVTPEANVIETKGVRRRQLSGGTVACTIHVGPYSKIGAAYDALLSWVDDHGHKRTGPAREVYLVRPGPGIKPQEYRTTVEIPIE